jgi:hypothetical protein
MTRAKRRGSRGARSKKDSQEARWAARSGPVYIVKPANRPKVEHQLDGLDLARAQYRRYKLPTWKIIPTARSVHTPPR